MPQYFINISFRTEVNNNTVIDEKYNLFVFNRGDTIEYHRGLKSRELGQAPMQLVGRRYHLTRVIRWSDCISYRIEIVCLISTLATILQRCTHNETHWPTAARQCHFALQDVSHPAGKVTISQHLATPGFSQFMNELLLKCSCVRLCTKSTRWMKDLQMRTNLSHNKQLSLGLCSVPTNELMAFQ